MKEEILKLKKIAKDKTILICEDDNDVLEELESIFSMFFKNVLIAKDGQEGLELYQKNKSIAVIITDINMPNLNGLDMMAKIKEIKDNQKGLVLSAHDDLKYVLQIVELGINQFIPKPYDIDDMLIKVFHILENVLLEEIIESQKEEMVSLVKTLEIFLLDEDFDKKAFKTIIKDTKEKLGISKDEGDFTIDMWESNS